MDVEVAKLDAKQVSRLSLDVGPCRRSAGGAFKHLAGRHRLAAHQYILAQEGLVRRVRGIDLIEVDPGRGFVAMIADVVGGPNLAVGAGMDGVVGRAGENHEVGRAARHVERVVRLQRNDDIAATALGGEVEAVVEELAENRHEPVERGGVAKVGGNVFDEDVVAVHRHAV
ncbi:hypothetical protein BLJAPNOD_06402 [Ensifer sp. M14]|nr:hypothetical protein BLJAPNOD_06402 [Ensifer sp. M14]